jgi:hypothetical protein
MVGCEILDNMMEEADWAVMRNAESGFRLKFVQTQAYDSAAAGGFEISDQLTPFLHR